MCNLPCVNPQTWDAQISFQAADVSVRAGIPSSGFFPMDSPWWMYGKELTPHSTCDHVNRAWNRDLLLMWRVMWKKMLEVWVEGKWNTVCKLWLFLAKVMAKNIKISYNAWENASQKMSGCSSLFVGIPSLCTELPLNGKCYSSNTASWRGSRLWVQLEQ